MRMITGGEKLQGFGPLVAPEPGLGRHYTVDGRSLFLERSGSGGPAVVFLPGAGGVGLDWLNIHRRVAQWTTSVLYDRGGTGWSDRLELPRTATEVATELRDLLRVAGIPGPYVLVGHSLGGVYVRRFGQLFPDEVAGVLAADVVGEEWDAHMPEKLRIRPAPVPGPLQLRLQGLFIRLLLRKQLADWPIRIRRALLAGHASLEWNLIAARERADMTTVIDEIRCGADAPDVPTIVLAALGTDPGMRLYYGRSGLRELTEAKQRVYQAMADSVPRGEYRAVTHASHGTLQTDAADEIVQAIRDLLDRAAR